jgi:uncharacterized coiled-coil DUF342 family protein
MRFLTGLVFGLIVFSVFQFSLASREGSKVKEKAGETIDATKEYAAAEKKEFEDKLNAELKDLAESIDELKSKAKKNGQEAKQEVQDQIKVLEAKRKDVAGKIKKLSQSTGKAWTQMKDGVQTAWDDLKSAFGKASAAVNE